MHRLLPFFLLVICFTFTKLYAQNVDSIAAHDLEPLRQSEGNVPLNDFWLVTEASELVLQSKNVDGRAKLRINGEEISLPFKAGKANLPSELTRKGHLLLLASDRHTKLYHVSLLQDQRVRIRQIPLWLSLLPPLFAIGLALVFREVLVSLFVGVWVGAFIAGGLRIESLYYTLLSLYEVAAKYIVDALADKDHMAIIVFSLLIGGMVAIISRNGGMAGVVQKLSSYATSARRAQLVTWLLGIAIFFDDYANTLIVGNTMRSVTDRFRVSREKLAYIVDSTAAPVVSIAFVTTWIGAELGYIDAGISLIDDISMTPYAIFLASLKYSFYPVLTLLFILMLIYFQRDFGPMHKAEIRARETGQVSPTNNGKESPEEVEDLSPIPGAPLRWANAVIPVASVIIVTLFGLCDTGMASIYAELAEMGQAPLNDSWGHIWDAMPLLLPEADGFLIRLGKLIGSSNSYIALLYASLSGVIIALLMTIGQRIMSLQKTMSTLTLGFKTMLPAFLILTLAWALAATTGELHTAAYLSGILQDSLPPHLLPPLIFILAAVISFSTGSSWSTMAILYPIAIPTTWAICQAQGMGTDYSMELLFNVISIVLGASVLGDHCSPISDTTILSSLASDCNHLEHVRTQLPYALTVGGVSFVMVTLAGIWGGGWLLSFLLLIVGCISLWGIIKWKGRPV